MAVLAAAVDVDSPAVLLHQHEGLAVAGVAGAVDEHAVARPADDLLVLLAGHGPRLLLGRRGGRGGRRRNRRAGGRRGGGGGGGRRKGGGARPGGAGRGGPGRGGRGAGGA